MATKCPILVILLQFDQDTAAVFRVEEHDGFAVCTDACLLGQGANLMLPHVFYGSVDVVDLKRKISKNPLLRMCARLTRRSVTLDPT